MMILRSSDPSPFGRKVKIAAHLTGTYSKMKIEPADTLDPNDAIRQQNPLGKIPALIIDDGNTLYDSRVICEYLDSLNTGTKLFPSGAERFDALRLQSLGDGIMDAAILIIYERRFRDEGMRSAKWTDHQQGKIDRAFEMLEGAPPALPKAPHIGHVTLACALGYFDVRFEGLWREKYRNLTQWLDAFSAVVPAYNDTMPKI